MVEERLSLLADWCCRHDGRRKRHRTPPRKARSLTVKQLEAVKLVTECKHNFSEAARRAGKTPPAMHKLYDKAHEKLGKRAIDLYAKTQSIPSDSNGQPLLADESQARDEQDERRQRQARHNYEATGTGQPKKTTGKTTGDNPTTCNPLLQPL